MTSGFANMASGNDSDSGSFGRKEKHPRDRSRETPTRKRHGSGGKIQCVPLIIHEDMTFRELQKRRLRIMEKRVEEEIRKKKKEWEHEVEKMKDEFLKLYPTDEEWCGDDLITDHSVLRRRGSVDVLDPRKLDTLILEYPDSHGLRYKLRFDVSDYDPQTVTVNADSDFIHVTAIKKMDGGDGTVIERPFSRKVQKPSDIPGDKFNFALTQDGILIAEAHVVPQSLNLQRVTASPSHSTYSTSSSPRSQSPSNTSPVTPTAIPKIGLPLFTGKVGERRLSLVVEIGKCFKPEDVLVQVVNSTKILIKAKQEERTEERFSKNKFCKEVELSEKIRATSLRAGLIPDGRLVVGALGKVGIPSLCIKYLDH